jgi:hypothetical protein
MSGQRRPGEVRDAIVEFLRKRQTGASIGEIHLAVEKALGSKVARSSVRSYLNLNTDSRPDAPSLFIRMARGSYRLRAR